MKQTAVLTLIFLTGLCMCRTRNIPNEIEFTSDDPDLYRNVSELISSKGYPVEDHYTQTSDGFILSLQRIPDGKNGNRNTPIGGKQVVFLQHGLLSAASDWVINFPKQSLGFILADAGYDVWMGNTRGNTYSRRHVKYTPSMQEFWNFSFDEMAQYDLPAMIDYVLNITGHEKIYYIGHSQGTTSAFALLSENPKYNEKIRLFIALAPVASVGYMTSAIRYLAPFSSDIDFLLKILGVKDFLPNNAFMKWISKWICEGEEKFLCEDTMFILCGADKAQINESRIGVIASHSPAGSSTRSVVHYAQMVNSKLFVKFDYGKKGNMQHYNQTTPPEYDVTRITAPVAIIWSMNDKLADPVDVGLLQRKLKSLVFSYCVPFPLFSHLDFVIGVTANKLVYDQVLAELAKY